MDPVSAVSSLLSLVDIALRTTSAIRQYAEAARNATSDRQLLAEEAGSLTHLLERLRTYAVDHQSDETWLSQRLELLRQFQHALDGLAKVLKLNATSTQLTQESRLKSALTIARWAFTKSDVYAILERLTRLQQYTNTLLVHEQSMVVDRIAETQQQGLTAQTRTEIMSWISPLNMSQLQRTLFDQAEKGSGRWFLKCNKFTQWLEPSVPGLRRRLWCSGMPGAGKTILTSVIVNHLQQWRSIDPSQVKIAIAVLYIRYNSTDQTPENLVASLIKQLMQELDYIPSSVAELHRRHSDYDTVPSLEELFTTLQTLLTEYERSYLVVDGLDECSEEVRWTLTAKLQELGSMPNLLFISRHIESIREELEGFDQIEIRAHQEDIELYVDQQVRKNRNLRRLVQRNPNVQAEIKRAVVKNADGMFLLARLHIESLSSAAAVSVRRVKDKLNSLPTTLNDSYDAAVSRIRGQDPEYRDMAWKTLSWLAYAYRSLSVGELQHALIVEAGNAELDEEAMMEGQAITAFCAGLVVIDQVNNVVNLVHYTAKRYVQTLRESLFPGFHATITMSCATYLTLDAMRNASLQEICRRFPLAGYAAQYMGDHARESPEDSLDSRILVLICDLLSTPTKRKPLLALLNSLDLVTTGFYTTSKLADNLEDEDFDVNLNSISDGVSDVDTDNNLVRLADDLGDLSSGDETASDITLAALAATNPWEMQTTHSRSPEVTALHLAASMGLAKVASMLLQHSSDIDAVDATGKTALAIAVERGMQKAVQLLIENGASVPLEEARGQAVFLLAAERGWDQVAESIISKTTRAQRMDSEVSDIVSFLIGSYRGELDEIPESTVSSMINNNLSSMSCPSICVFLAVERGHCQLVQRFVHAGVNVNVTDGHGQTALHRAATRKDMKMLKTLLAIGADVNARNHDGWSALTANTRSQDESLTRFLISAGADANLTSHNGNNELYGAASEGNLAYVKFLLSIGTNPSIQTRYGWAPLHWASHHGHIEVVKALIDAGADVCCISDQDVCPLDLADGANQLEVARLLRQAGGCRREDLLHTTVEDTMSPLTSTDSTRTTLADQGKVSLTFDEPFVAPAPRWGQFLYQSNGSRVYCLSQPLEHPTTNTLKIRMASDHAKVREYDMISKGIWPARITFEEVMFEITRVRAEVHEFSIKSGVAIAEAPESLIIRSWTGDWKVHQIEDGVDRIVCRTLPDWSQSSAEGREGTRFVDTQGNLLARTGWRSGVPVADVENHVPLALQHQFVAYWITILWAELSTGKPVESD